MAVHDANRTRLEDEKARLERELAALTGEEQAADGRDRRGYANHLADGASDTLEQEQVEALCRHVRGTLDLVEKALRKMDAGAYGSCEACTRPIAADRLAALPHVALCLECQAKRERRR